ncbi:sporulation protein YunB [Cohnella kolymensis]|uniref:sporulation protein YunB n=1 Tax=Cohnella kolymensis TaxID=1590652 RepID=UPI000696D804|nr:sporulation protein YunB [Cohnella kolymensis]
MRRKWGKGFNFWQGGAPMNRAPRRWGNRGFRWFGSSTPPKAVPRKWGTQKWSQSSSAPGYTTTSRRWGGPRRKRLKRKHLWLITLLLIVFLSMQTVLFLDRELREPLMFLAKLRITQMATEAINTAITQEIARDADTDKLIQWRTDPNGKVTGFLIDYKEQMRLTAKTIQVVDQVLKQREDVAERIPIGHALKSPFLSSFGPSVGVTFHPVSALKVDVDTRQTDAGINMVLIEVLIRIRTEIAVVIPFDQAPEMLESEIPLSYVMVVGDVPTYYYDNNGQPVGSGAAQAPSIALPGSPKSPEEPH